VKSPGRALAQALRPRNAGKPPIPLDNGRAAHRGLSYNLGNGRADAETMLRQYGISGTLYGIVSLLAEASATPNWRLYKKQPVDGRRRYSTGDTGSDQRIEVVQHAAIQLWNSPNDFHTRFEFSEGSQQHEELTGETFWVLDNEAGFPTSMWYVRPDRMEPIPDPDEFLVGWIYTGPNGENVPLRRDEVILEKRPDPLDPYRGAGPIASILPNIQQQRYATEYQRNLFLNGADPGGVITVPNNLTEPQFDELVDRWRDNHRGVARAGQVGVLEGGAIWTPNANTNKDMEYGALRLANRDEEREAYRIHKAMMGTSDDVNRANAQTAEEVFVGWQIIPRLNRRRDTLNNKLLPLFGNAVKSVEFDYDDPFPPNAENVMKELLTKAQSWAALVDGGADPRDALEVVGLPDMKMAEVATQAPALPPGWVPGTPPAAPGAPAADGVPAARQRITVTATTAPTPPAAQPDLSAVDQQWRDATAQLAAQYQQQIAPAQQRQAADQTRDIAAAGTLASLASLTISSAAASALILGAMTAYAHTSAQQASREMQAQGATAPPVPAPPQQLQQIAEVTAALLAAELAVAAGREALRLAQAGQSPAQVADGVTQYLAGLSAAGLQAHLSGAMSAAQNKARIATFTGPAAPRAMLTATEMHDKNVCDPCDLINGHEFGYSDDPDAVASAHAAYPVGGYIECKGEDRCRGTLFAVMQAAPAPRANVPPLPTVAMPDYLPLAQLMRHQLGAPVNGHALNGHSRGARR
jgi:HK97 family phage portal protein